MNSSKFILYSIIGMALGVGLIRGISQMNEDVIFLAIIGLCLYVLNILKEY